MYECLSLEGVTFAADLSKLKNVADSWLSSCSMLRHVTQASDLQQYSVLKQHQWFHRAEGRWMFCCWSLKHVDLTGFTALEAVGDC